MTGLQLAMLSGAALSAGLVLIVAGLIPAPVHLKDAIGRLQPTTHHTDTIAGAGTVDAEVRLGRWAEQHLPAIVWGTPPDRDLALLGRTRAAFYGSKIISAVLGLLVVPVISVATMLLGLPIPVAVPVLGSLGLAVVLWFLPNNELRDQARKAREEFSYALGAFVEMVALERSPRTRSGRSGPGPRRQRCRSGVASQRPLCDLGRRRTASRPGSGERHRFGPSRRARSLRSLRGTR
jgi:hypothetical protein